MRHISWEEYHNLCEQLADQFKHLGFETVYGLPRGGLITATIISHYMNIPLVTEISDDMAVYDTILVDDIADSGQTLKNLPHQIRTATLFLNTNRCRYYPDYFAQTTTEWIVFPYEYEKDSVSKVKKRYAR